MRRFRFLFIPIILIPLATIVLMLLWNWLMPALFSLGTITFLQALGLLILLRILIGPRFGFPFFRRYAFYGYGYPGWGYYRRGRMYEKWKSMSEEEKAKFRHHFRCGYYYPSEGEPKEREEESNKET